MKQIRTCVAALVGLVVVLAGLVGAVPARGASGFVDVPPGTAFEAEITWVAQRGIATGWERPDGTHEYRPLSPVNRDAMAAFLHRLAGSPPVSLPATSPFADLSPTTEHYAAIIWAWQKGITTGWSEPDGSRTYRPTTPIARDAMAAFLYRYAGSPAYTPPATTQFWDLQAGTTYNTEIHWLRSKGITTGWAEPFGCPTYRPLTPIARDAMAAFLYRFVNGGPAAGPDTCADKRLGRDWETLPTTWPVVALTFDGGASNTGVDRILSTLRTKGVPATFFVTGDFARRYPDAVRAMAADGHPVGNHSMTHPGFTTLTADQIRSELSRAEAQIVPLTGKAAKPLFRYPLGDRNATTTTVVNGAGYVPFRWTVDSLGWQGTAGGRTPAWVCQRVLATVQPGQVVLMHVGAHPTDGSTLDADALACIIDGTRARGYGFFTLDAFAR